MNEIRSTDSPVYFHQQGEEDATIARALAILASRIKAGPVLDAPSTVRQYLMVRAADHPLQEVFSVVFLDAHHRVLEARQMFFGSLTTASVYPREVARVALEIGAAAVILSHNHPSGSVEPSRADERLTDQLKKSLELVDVRVLDHIIVSGGDSLSMAERGLM